MSVTYLEFIFVQCFIPLNKHLNKTTLQSIGLIYQIIHELLFLCLASFFSPFRSWIFSCTSIQHGIHSSFWYSFFFMNWHHLLISHTATKLHTLCDIVRLYVTRLCNDEPFCLTAFLNI